MNPDRSDKVAGGVRQAPAWEYKVGILHASSTSSAIRADLQEPLLKTLGRNGWIFVSESQGRVLFKRPKRPHGTAGCPATLP
jgi:hypothetical protein